MTIAFVKAAGATAGYGSSNVSVAFGSNVAQGSLISVVSFRYSDVTAAFAAGDCTKSAGTATIDTPALDVGVNYDAQGGAAWGQVGIWSCLVTAAGSLTMQVAGGTDKATCIAVSEYTGSFDSVAANRREATNSNSVATDNQTPGHSNDATSAGAALFIGGLAVQQGGVSLTITPDAAFTQIYENEAGATSQVGAAIYRLVTSGTTDRAEWTLPTSNNTGYCAAVAVYKENAATIEQRAFRFGADDGTESGHTFLANQNTNINRALSTPTLIRFLLQTVGAPGARGFRLQWKRSTESDSFWRDVS